MQDTNKHASHDARRARAYRAGQRAAEAHAPRVPNTTDAILFPDSFDAGYSDARRAMIHREQA